MLTNKFSAFLWHFGSPFSNGKEVSDIAIAQVQTIELIKRTSIELIKNSPDKIHQNIAEIYNIIAATGEFPKEINKGIITPLQKPGKPKGPV